MIQQKGQDAFWNILSGKKKQNHQRKPIRNPLRQKSRYFSHKSQKAKKGLQEGPQRLARRTLLVTYRGRLSSSGSEVKL